MNLEYRVSYDDNNNGIVHLNFDTLQSNCQLSLNFGKNREVTHSMLELSSRINGLRVAYGNEAYCSLMGTIPSILANIIENEFPYDSDLKPLRNFSNEQPKVLFDKQEQQVEEQPILLTEEELMEILSEDQNSQNRVISPEFLETEQVSDCTIRCDQAEIDRIQSELLSSN